MRLTLDKTDLLGRKRHCKRKVDLPLEHTLEFGWHHTCKEILDDSCLENHDRDGLGCKALMICDHDYCYCHQGNFCTKGDPEIDYFFNHNRH